MNIHEIRNTLFEGIVIPAIPLALHEDGNFDHKHQKALLRYYIDAGVGGIAAAVHTTQFEIRNYEPFFNEFLDFVSLEIDSYSKKKNRRILKIGGICGNTDQALKEARLLKSKGYHVGLLSLSAFKNHIEEDILSHCRAIANEIPILGFYLQTAVGGIPLSFDFWKEFAGIPNVVGIKVAPFNRYQTLDVIRALAESGRHKDVALYTGNDDSIVFDLISEYPFFNPDGTKISFTGGLLGHWCVWTQKAVSLLIEIKELKRNRKDIPREIIEQAHKITDANSAVFDARNGYAGVIPGVHEILRRQGLLSSTRCLDSNETLSEGQQDEIDRVMKAYPDLQDTAFINEHIDDWMNA